MKNALKHCVGLQLLLLSLVIIAMSPSAFAAQGSKQWSVQLSPITATATPGVASNIVSTVTIKQGSALAASTNGVTLSLAVSPSGQGVNASLQGTGPFTGVSSTTSLTISNTAAAPARAYTITVTGASTFSGSSDFTAGDANVFTYNVGAPPSGTLWTPGGVNNNWSTPGNWNPNGPPVSTNDVFFNDTGIVGTQGSVDNIVDSNIVVASLTYGQTNNYHTTQIASGKSLTISGNTNGLNAGTGTAAGDGLQPYTTVTGAGGTLIVSNAGANVNVDQSEPISGTGNSSTMATLDLSGLDTFKANVARLLVGVDTTQALRGACGVLDLARTNTITATPGSASPQIDVGDNTQSGASPGLPSFLLLGQTNGIFADSIATGRGKSDSGGGSSILFNTSFTSPTAFFRGTNGAASRVSIWTIGDGWGAKSSQNSGTNDFTGGNVNALVDQMIVGRGASTSILSGANVPGNGTLTFNAGSFNINTLQAGVTQSDAGSTGTVNVNGGSLVVNTNLQLAVGSGSTGNLNVFNATATANNGITANGGNANVVLSGATLNATNTKATLGTAASPLASFAVTNSILNVAAQAGSPAATASNFSCDGANTINITAMPLIETLPMQVPLIQYSSAGGNLGSFSLGALPGGVSPAYGGYISNNTANSSIDLVITSGPIFYPLIWTGVPNGNWDIGATANWKSNNIVSTYQQGYLIVQFDDTAANSSVNLTTILTPGAINVNNSSANYIFNGTGKISGAASLAKAGSGTLTLAESGGNDFTGGVTVTGGTLQVGNGGTTGSLGAGAVEVETNAVVDFDRSDNITVANVFGGSGTVVQGAPDILTLSGSNAAFSGSIMVTQGTLRLGNPTALGSVAGGTAISAGATLDVNGQKLNNAEPITVSGAGVGGAGAIVNNSTNAVTQSLRVVALTGNTSFGGLSDWDIHSSGNGTFDASLTTSDNTNVITKIGTNTVTLFGVSVDGNLGDIQIQAGTLSVERETTGLGNSVNTITVFTNATLQFQNASNVWTKNVVLNGGATIKNNSSNEFGGPITLQTGVGTFSIGTGSALLLDQAVGGSGGLAKAGAGTLTLSSPSTYSGATSVTGGTLALNNSGSIDSSTNITLSTGTSLDLSALSTPILIMTTSRSLNGGGAVLGSVTMSSGSSLNVGGPGSNTIGTLTVTNSLVLQTGSTTLMEVNKTGSSATNDEVVVTNVTYGGTLTVTCSGGALAAGDTFTLFAAGSYGGTFNAINLPVGVTWNTTQLGVNGTIQVVSVSRPNITSGGSSTNGAFQLGFSGPAGNSYRVWATTNAAARPIASTWTQVANGQFSAGGTANFVDNSSTNFPMRFYTITVP